MLKTVTLLPCLAAPVFLSVAAIATPAIAKTAPAINPNSCRISEGAGTLAVCKDKTPQGLPMLVVSFRWQGEVETWIGINNHSTGTLLLAHQGRTTEICAFSRLIEPSSGVILYNLSSDVEANKNCFDGDGIIKDPMGIYASMFKDPYFSDWLGLTGSKAPLF